MRFIPHISFEHAEEVLPDPALVAARELNEARMDKLKAEREREYWISMVDMLNVRIDRLTTVAGSKRADEQSIK
jgi:hypothetical protein